MTKTFSPSSFLKDRRPERYSDSLDIEVPQLTQDLLEYHLDTLTSRNQHTEFEYFARKLAEKELCPNLLPQTGPTGGGDSKVDSETYPVAEGISLAWYQGNASASERWAFAISAKKVWRAKVQSDVKKIVNTNRDYTLIYFITNQFVSDKKRAEVEDALTTQYKIDIRILDRSWIVDKIINHGHIELAANTLSIPSLLKIPQKQLGPNDAKKQVELKALDEEINDPNRYSGLTHQIAEDCLEAAVLASELKHNRNEVEGRFSAAKRIAENNGDERQLLRINYRQAWVACYVYEDITELIRLYDEVEKLGLKSSIADDVELVSNLWNTLFGSIKSGLYTADDHNLAKKGKVLREKLEELSQDDSRPNGALHAKTMLTFNKLNIAQYNQIDALEISNCFRNLNEIADDCSMLPTYPFETFSKIVLELGDFFPENQHYEELFDKIVSIQAGRSSEGDAGIAIHNRGVQKFKAGKYYDAIRLFGRAQEKLAKEEYQGVLIQCLVAIGGAYKKAGLPWAARASLLTVCEICIKEQSLSGYMNPLARLAAEDLVWIELKLARVPNIIFSFVLLQHIVGFLKFENEEQEEYLERFFIMDNFLAISLLRLNQKQLEDVRKLPYLLDQTQLAFSERALLFALGEIQKVKEVFFKQNNESTTEIGEFYSSLCSQPDAKEIDQLPELCLEDTIKLKSNILGIAVIAEVGANPTSILIAESLLGILESFLATSLSDGIMPYKQDAKLIIRLDNNLQNDAGIKLMGDCSNCDLEITHNLSFSPGIGNSAHDFRKFQMDFIAYFLPKLVVFDNIEEQIKRLAEEESIFSRSLLFSDMITLSKNIFGGSGSISLKDLTSTIDKEPYQLKRTKQWQPNIVSRESVKPNKEERSENLENVSHAERTVLSLIDVPVWDQAKWDGASYLCAPGMAPPCLALMFRDEKAATKIFNNWRIRFGSIDKKEEIRICIITGIDKQNEAYYRIHITSNLDALGENETNKLLFIASRDQTMSPNSHINLNNFLEAYNIAQSYGLMPAVFTESLNKPKLLYNLILDKKTLIVKPAWKISEDDIEYAALKPDDDPIIPKSETNAPIIKALEKLRSMKN